MNPIDLNIDMGEGMGNENELMPLINSCNIACGGHAGSLEEMQRVIDLAIKHKVKIGAHPSYPDRENFGRVSIRLSEKKLVQSLRDQLYSFMELLEDKKQLHHVKPHGALYNDCAKNPEVAEIVLNVIEECCPHALLFTLPKSVLEQRAKARGITIWREAFLDRGYTAQGKLQTRGEKGALLTTASAMSAQLNSIVEEHQVQAVSGQWIPMKAETFCLHGDHPNVVRNLKELLNLYPLQP